jgi:hypothetical protein
MNQTLENFVQNLKLTPDAQPNKGKAKLQSFCDVLQKKMRESSGGDVRVVLVPGYNIDIGMEQKVIIEMPNRKHIHVLFRAYVPKTGYPIKIDFYGEELKTCSNEAEVDAAIAEFLSQPEVLSGLMQFVQLAKSPE